MSAPSTPFFGPRTKLTRDQITSLTHGGPEDRCWTDDRERLLVRAVDALHESATVDPELWAHLAEALAAEQLLDLLMLCGWYHAISFAANATRVGLEDGAPRFSDYAADG